MGTPPRAAVLAVRRLRQSYQPSPLTGMRYLLLQNCVPNTNAPSNHGSITSSTPCQSYHSSMPSLSCWHAGPHELSKPVVNKPEEMHSALQILRDSFLTSRQPQGGGPSAASAWLSPRQLLCTEIASFSGHGTLLVPDPRHRKLPLHVIANNKPQPWQLLPMRAAALKQYPDFFGQSALFFASLNGAVHKGAATQLVRPSKVRPVLPRTCACCH